MGKAKLVKLVDPDSYREVRRGKTRLGRDKKINREGKTHLGCDKNLISEG
jgi:hypothetical protein